MINPQDELVNSIIELFNSASTDRGTWESHWQEIAARCWPAYNKSFNVSAIGNELSQGAKQTEEMVDSTAALALPKFAAAMEGMLTPRNQTWHQIKPIDNIIKRNRIAMQWYDDVNTLLFRYRYAPYANFATQMSDNYMSLGAFGTGAMFVDKLDDQYGGGIRYKNIHLAELFFLENHQGLVDCAFRKFYLHPRQAIQKFGEDNLPDEIVNQISLPSAQKIRHFFIHCVRPREEFDPLYEENSKSLKGTFYGSWYVSLTGRKLVQEGGYNAFPYAISRYSTAPGEIYGRSPVMLALPTIKTVNEIKKTILKAGHRAVSPPLLAHDDGVLDGFNVRPDALNYGAMTADGRELVKPLVGGKLEIADKLLEDERNVINDALLVHLFQILLQSRPQMTATEVLEIIREKGVLVSPTMGRQETECLGPIIDRELDVLAKQRLLPPIPPIVQQSYAAYQIHYDSPLARAQRAESGSGFMRLLQTAQEFVAVTQDPSMLDWFNFDVAIPAMADLQAVPTSWISSQDDVDAKRQSRQQAQQQQQMVEAAPSLASVAKALPSVRLTGQTGNNRGF